MINCFFFKVVAVIAWLPVVCGQTHGEPYNVPVESTEPVTLGWDDSSFPANSSKSWGLPSPLDTHRLAANESAFSPAPSDSSLRFEPPIQLVDARADDRWTFELSPYIWATGVKGFLGADDRGSSYALDIGDVVNLMDEVEMMAFGSLKAKKNRTSFFVDFIYSKMDHLTSGDLGLKLPAIARNDLDLKWEELFLQFGAGYTVCEFKTPGGRKTSLDIQGGGRYLYISGTDEIIGGRDDRIQIGIDGSENFIEPWIGAMVEAELSVCTTLVAGGDIGGFGHGEADGTNWQYYAKVKYQLSPQVSLDAGYRHLRLNYEDTLGGRDFQFDQEVYGPTVGLTFEF